MLITTNVQRNVVVVDWIVDQPFPACVTVAERNLPHKLSVRDIDEVVRDLNTDAHAFNFVAPLILVGPPDRRAFTFASGVNPWSAKRVLAKSDTTKSARLDWVTV